MNSMSCFDLKKRDLNVLIETLSKNNDVFAPVKMDGVTNFERVKDANEIMLH
jgi:hypothetical protein